MSQSCTPIHQGQHVDLTSHHTLPFRMIDHLGMGGSATVYEVEDETNGQRFAHKIFPPCSGSRLKRLKQAVKDEIDIIKRLHSHPHIIKLYWSYTRERTFGMLLSPVANNGDLSAYFETIQSNQGTITPQQFSVLSRSFGCLASGLAFIHSRTIRHKDIKPKNILVHNGKMIYTDFGISLDMSGQDTTTTGQANARTKRYCAPEVGNSEPRNKKSDVFSLGCVFLEIMALLAPDFHVGTFNEDLSYWQRVDDIQDNLRRIGECDCSSSQMLLICRAMMEYKSADRVDADAVLSRVQSLRRCFLKPTYELFCEDCESSSAVTAQTSTNTLVEAISDARCVACKNERRDQFYDEDEKSQAGLSVVLSRLAIDLQAAKDPHDVATQEGFNCMPEVDIDTSSSLHNDASLQSQHEHRCSEAKDREMIPLQSRILPGTLQKILEHICLLEIHSMLSDDEYRCVAPVSSTRLERCTIKMPSASDWIFKKLFGCSTDTTYSEFLNHIGSLVQAVMCASHQKAILSRESITTILELISSQSYLSNEDCSYLRMWIGQHHAKWSKMIPVPDALRKASMSPLRPLDKRDGFLYIICDKKSRNVKIGCTGDIARKVRRWNHQCKKKYHLSSSLGQHIRIPHVYRVEKLIRIELREFRIKAGCESCGVIHRKWYGVEETVAVEVVQKWQNWVAQKPYILSDVSGEWRFRRKMLDTLPHPVQIS